MALRFGTEGADDIIGTNSGDLILARGGDDRITGLLGNDRIFGDVESFDTAVFSGNAADYTTSFNIFQPTITNISGPDGNDTLFRIDALEFDDGTVFVGPNRNISPLPKDDAETTSEDRVLDVPAAGVLANDVDIDGDSLTVTEVNGDSADVGSQITLPSGALLTLNTDGSFSYDPNGVFDGLDTGDSDTDTFDYTADDGNGGTGTATVTITINGVGGVDLDALVANGSSQANKIWLNQTVEGSPGTFSDSGQNLGKWRKPGCRSRRSRQRRRSRRFHHDLEQRYQQGAGEPGRRPERHRGRLFRQRPEPRQREQQQPQRRPRRLSTGTAISTPTPRAIPTAHSGSTKAAVKAAPRASSPTAAKASVPSPSTSPLATSTATATSTPSPPIVQRGRRLNRGWSPTGSVHRRCRQPSVRQRSDPSAAWTARLVAALGDFDGDGDLDVLSSPVDLDD